LKLYRKLSRSGRTLLLRIPSDLERQMELKEETEVAITKIGSKIVIEKERPKQKR
jgi:antitoxin component of MazEF toxin-antitoxin module